MGGVLHFAKMIIFQVILGSFSSSFLKNGRKMKTENEAKMAVPPNGYCEQP